MPDRADAKPPRVRVVVLNWNAWWFSRRCLRALERTEYDPDRLEVVLVDNASIDGSLERLRAEFPDVRFIANSSNLGFAEGCNRAMRDLHDVDHVALVNNDAVPDPGWLAPLVEALERRPVAGAVSARLVLEPSFSSVQLEVAGELTVSGVLVDGVDASTRTQYLGFRSVGRPEWPLELVHHLDDSGELLVPVGPAARRLVLDLVGTGRLYAGTAADQVEVGLNGGQSVVELTLGPDRVELLNGLGTDRNDVGESFDRHFAVPASARALPELIGEPLAVKGFCGGGVLLRTEMLRQVGLLEPRFFAYYEDTELSWRAGRNGWEILAAPSSVIRHAFGGSGGASAPGFFFLNYRNWLLAVLLDGTPAQRRAALRSAFERFRVAARSNLASPLRHGSRPRTRLVRSWIRVFAGVPPAWVRIVASRRRGPAGSTPVDAVRSALQPQFSPSPPSPRPGGPLLVHVDVSDSPDAASGDSDALLARFSAADEQLDVVPVVRSSSVGDYRRASPAEVAHALGRDGPLLSVEPDGLLLGALRGPSILVEPDGSSGFRWRRVGEFPGGAADGPAWLDGAVDPVSLEPLIGPIREQLGPGWS